MSEEFDREGRTVVRPTIGTWDFTQREREYFVAAKNVKNWRLADESRRYLADLTEHLGAKLPSFADRPIEEIDRRELIRPAVGATCAILVRASGSGMSLLACGYLAEAAGPARRGLEAKLNARAIVDDPSGQYALAYLGGRSRGLTKLAGQYGHAEDVKLLSTIAHADVRGLAKAWRRAPQSGAHFSEGLVDFFPSRDDASAGYLLYVIASEAYDMCHGIAQVFDVDLEIAPAIGDEIKRQRELFEHLNRS